MFQFESWFQLMHEKTWQMLHLGDCYIFSGECYAFQWQRLHYLLQDSF